MTGMSTELANVLQPILKAVRCSAQFSCAALAPGPQTLHIHCLLQFWNKDVVHATISQTAMINFCQLETLNQVHPQNAVCSSEMQ